MQYTAVITNPHHKIIITTIILIALLLPLLRLQDDLYVME